MHNTIFEGYEGLEMFLIESNGQIEIILKFVNEKKSSVFTNNATDS